VHESFTWFHLFLPEHYTSHHFIHVVIGYFIGVLLLVAACIFFFKMKGIQFPEVPTEKIGLRNFFEVFGEAIYSLCKSILGEHYGRQFFPLIGTLFLFILVSNLSGLFPGFIPPTDNVNTTLAIGIFVFLYYNYQGFKENGLRYLAHFAGPLWYLAPLVFAIEVVSHLVRPVSLALRLRGNMFGDHMVLSIFSDMVPYVVPVPFLVLGTLVSFIQAFVFCLLTMVYLTLATAHDH